MAKTKKKPIKNKYEGAENEPLFAINISLADSTLKYTTGALALLSALIGDEKAAQWHSKYRDKFDAIIKESTQELNDIAAALIEEKEK